MPRKIAIAIQHGQQRKSDAGGLGGSDDPFGKFGAPLVRLSARPVMKVMKLSNARIAGLEHLDVRERGDRFELLGINMLGQLIHLLAPRPKRIGSPCDSALGTPCEGALKTVRMHIGHPRYDGAREQYRAVRRRIRRDGGEKTVVADLQENAERPSARQQRDRSEEAIHVTREIWEHARIATMRAPDSYGLIEDASIVTENRMIAWVGASAALPVAMSVGANQAHDCAGRCITPGLIDPHTHLVYAGNRAHEFEMRLAGIDYAEIARQGGGILSTVRTTRAASEYDLLAAAQRRPRAFVGSA